MADPRPHHYIFAHRAMPAIALEGLLGKKLKGLRYFTLEKGTHLDGRERTVLCEWSQEGHSNYGDGPENTPEAFWAAAVGLCT